MSVMDITTGREVVVSEAEPTGITDLGAVGPGPALHPTWFGDHYLLNSTAWGGYDEDYDGDGYGTTEERDWNIFGRTIQSDLSPSESTPLLGSQSGHYRRQKSDGTYVDLAFQDADVRDPDDVETSYYDAFREMRITTTGVTRIPSYPLSEPPIKKGTPRVTRLFNTGVIIDTQEFLLGENKWGDAITEAHHGDFSPTGNQLIVYVHEPHETRLNFDILRDSDIETNALYIYTQESSCNWNAANCSWKDPEPAINHKGSHELDKTLWPDSCTLYQYKPAQFCLNDNHIVFTLSCNGSESRTFLGSRVILTKRSTNEWWDLTSFIEDWYGYTRGYLHGQKPTCSKRQGHTHQIY